MTSEIRANTLKNRVGLGTVSFTNTGPVVSGIVTANSFSGLISGTTGTFSGDVDVDGHTNLDNVNIAGVTTTTDNIIIDADNKRLQIGDDQDLELYHTGTVGHIKNNTGILKITGANGQKIDFVDASNGYYARFNSGNSCELHFGGSGSRIVTQSYGALVNGELRLTTGGNGYTFLNDPDTGMYNPFNGGLNFRVNGSNRLTMSNVGIATFSNINVEIKKDLDVDGHTNLDNVSVSGVSTFTGAVTAHDYRSGGGVGNTLYLTSADDWRFRTTGGSEKLRITSDGKVGIGTDNPTTYKLHLQGSTSALARFERTGGSFAKVDIKAGSSSGNSYLTFSDPDASEVGEINYEHADNSLRFNTNSSERLRIDSTGRLILGGSSAGPYHQDGDEFNIYSTGNTGMSIFSGTSSLGSLFFADDNNDVHGQRRGAIQYNHNGNYLTLWTNASEKLRITSDGDIRIPYIGNGTGLRQKIQFVTEANYFDEVGYISMDRTAVSGAPSDMVFATGDVSTVSEKLRIHSGGLVEALSSFSDTYSTTTSISPHFRARNQNGTDNIYGGIQLRADRGNGAAAIFNIACLNSSASYASTLVFQSRNTDGNFSEKLRIDSNGNMGLGLSPAYSGIFGGAQRTFQIGGTAAPCLRITSSSSGQADLVVHAGNSGRRADIANMTTNGAISIWTKPSSGSIAERIKISSAGYVTKPANPSFHARPPGNYSLSGDTIVGGTWTTSNSENFVRGTLSDGTTSIWDNSGGVFTVPVDGIYFLHWSVFLSNNTTRRDAMIYLNGTGGGNIIARTEIGDAPDTTGTNKNVSVTTVVSLSVNDEIRFGCLTTGGNSIYTSTRPWSYACGYLVG